MALDFEDVIYLELSETIRAPREEVFRLNANYEGWPQLFPDVKSLRVIGEQYGETVIEIGDGSENVEKTVLRKFAPTKMVKEVSNGILDGMEMYSFDALGDSSTRVTLTFLASMKGLYKLSTPFIKGYLRTRLRELRITPVKELIEAGRACYAK